MAKPYEVPKSSGGIEAIDDNIARMMEEEAKDHRWNYEFNVIDSIAVKTCMTENVVNDLYLCLKKTKDHFYYDNQVHALIHNHSYKIPVFDIKISHLNEQVKYELDCRSKNNNKNELDYILKEAVGKIFDNVSRSYSYFFLSVKRLLNVRLIA